MGSVKAVSAAGVKIGGGAPVRVESMLKSRLTDVSSCISETEALLSSGCELARVALPEAALAAPFAELVKQSRLPLMADIHFDYRLALAALEAGCRAIRINPGNMNSVQGVREAVAAASAAGAVIRIGANGGSLSNIQLEKTNGDRGAALVLAVEEQLAILTGQGFENIIISAKSSNIAETVRANSILAQRWPFPLHIGITEAGCGLYGTVKGAVGIGTMLSQGIGDTIRVSLTQPGVEEVETGYAILAALGLRTRGWQLVSCPTCGRRRIEVASLVERLRRLIPSASLNGTTIAVMGCEVNGPREAANADIGIACSPEGFIVFKKGNFVCNGLMEDFEKVVSRELNISELDHL